jgi:hypothetical protein
MAGRAMVRLGEALVDRTEALDRAVAANRRAIDDLEARVERLEHNQS